MGEWKSVDGVPGECRLTIGALCIDVRIAPFSENFEWSMSGPSGPSGDTLPINEAKSDAEQALREMHDALSAHFAPVLRWEDIHPSLSTARLGEWMIDVTNGGWYLFLICEDGRRLVRDAVTIEEGLTHAERKRAAEATLRALGVIFRVDGE